ncbi:MAG: hypothetical protein PHS82_02020 [Lachnospiraceae bacterium]|nr:hypothetical protein [Lachnospiraceae bacterium]
MYKEMAGWQTPLFMYKSISTIQRKGLILHSKNRALYRQEHLKEMNAYEEAPQKSKEKEEAL